jgi:hypothetical protein
LVARSYDRAARARSRRRRLGVGYQVAGLDGGDELADARRDEPLVRQLAQEGDLFGTECRAGRGSCVCSSRRAGRTWRASGPARYIRAAARHTHRWVTSAAIVWPIARRGKAAGAGRFGSSGAAADGVTLEHGQEHVQLLLVGARLDVVRGCMKRMPHRP